LKGEDIPLTGRLMAIADVYDALISRRVYKEAFSHQVARETIISERGRHFDPKLVDAFLAIEDEILAIVAQYNQAS
jgi:response regulator RpfG family c-di-GMP phosphodiesterase